MEHTEGKWEIRDSGKGTITFIESGVFCICQLAYCSMNEHDGHKLQLANARLIAAAPELLAACEIAVLALTHKPINPDDIKYIKEVVAKAKNAQDAPDEKRG